MTCQVVLFLGLAAILIVLLHERAVEFELGAFKFEHLLLSQYRLKFGFGLVLNRPYLIAL